MAKCLPKTVLVIVLVAFVTCEDAVKPNVVLIIADDLGWNDVSFHGSDQIQTPNIDALAHAGVILHQYRTHCLCTPSRAALLTGKFAHKLGMQGYPLTNGEDRGLPLSEKILPQYLKENNYTTHLVGKWHLGHSRSAYLPNNRGFDTFFGHRGGFLDYYEYVTEELWTSGKQSGLDLFRDEIAAWDVEGYITDVYTEEAKRIIKSHDTSRPMFLQLAHAAPHSGNDGSLLQAPPEVVRAMRHVESPERRVYAAMVKKLDDSVGEIIEALSKKQMLSNTIIVFISDNGGMTVGDSLNWASNWPLRGLKISPFEGGIRAIGTVWSAQLNGTSHVWQGRIHVADWLPTILQAVKAEVPNNIDGIDMWNEILHNKVSPRDKIYEIDDYSGFGAILSGRYKLIMGDVNVQYSHYYGDDLNGIIGSAPKYKETVKNSKTYKAFRDLGNINNLGFFDNRKDLLISCRERDPNQCYPGKDKLCLFDIEDDPCESLDISSTYPDVVAELRENLLKEWDKRLPRKVPLFRDPRALPSLHNYTWASSWYDEYICCDPDI